MRKFRVDPGGGERGFTPQSDSNNFLSILTCLDFSLKIITFIHFCPRQKYFTRFVPGPLPICCSVKNKQKVYMTSKNIIQHIKICHIFSEKKTAKESNAKERQTIIPNQSSSPPKKLLILKIFYLLNISF